jgi:hypothetical protein
VASNPISSIFQLVAPAYPKGSQPPNDGIVYSMDISTLQSPNYQIFSKLIRDSRFYSVSLELNRFLAEAPKCLHVNDLKNAVEACVKKVEILLQNVIRTHNIPNDNSEAFLDGFFIHMFYQLHPLIWKLKENDSLEFRSKLAYLNLIKYDLASLGVEDSQKLIQAPAWQPMVQSIGKGKVHLIYVRANTFAST